MYYKATLKVTSKNVDLAELDLSNLTYLERFHEKYSNNSKHYLYSIESDILTILSITTHSFDKFESIETTLHSYLSQVPITYEELKINRITYKRFNNMIDNLSGFMTPENQNTTYLIGDSELDQYIIYTDMGKFAFNELDASNQLSNLSKELIPSYQQELSRIHSSKSNSFIGHPVHYHIQCDLVEEAEKLAESLIIQLQNNNRLLCNRLVKINVNPRNRFSDNLTIELAQHMASGGSIFFDLSTDLDSNEIKNLVKQLSLLCQSINRTQHEVLYFFYSNVINSKSYELIQENLNINLLTLKPDNLTFEQSKDYLTSRFIEEQLNTELIDKYILKSELYTLSQLDYIVAQSSHNKFVSLNFPSYTNLENNNNKVNFVPTQNSIMELNQLIGLTTVKHRISEIVNAHSNLKNYSLDLNLTSFSNHMVFMGNPGTAKTTVARIIGKIFKENQILSVGDFFEISRSDLIERYVGWTAQNIHDIFVKAKGSVLFIDEAYSLLDTGYTGYGDEAIATIIQEMENNRDDIVVIFAGYPEKMDSFINSNPGLRSRIQHYIHFDDYSVSELLKITNYMLGKHNFTITQDAKHLLTQHFINIKNNKNFGNAREVRNIIEQAITTQLSKLNLDKDSSLNPEYLILKSEDFIFLDENKNQSIRLIN